MLVKRVTLHRLLSVCEASKYSGFPQNHSSGHPEHSLIQEIHITKGLIKGKVQIQCTKRKDNRVPALYLQGNNHQSFYHSWFWDQTYSLILQRQNTKKWGLRTDHKGQGLRGVLSPLDRRIISHQSQETLSLQHKERCSWAPERAIAQVLPLNTSIMGSLNIPKIGPTPLLV